MFCQWHQLFHVLQLLRFASARRPWRWRSFMPQHACLCPCTYVEGLSNPAESMHRVAHGFRMKCLCFCAKDLILYGLNAAGTHGMRSLSGRRGKTSRCGRCSERSRRHSRARPVMALVGASRIYALFACKLIPGPSCLEDVSSAACLGPFISLQGKLDARQALYAIKLPPVQLELLH